MPPPSTPFPSDEHCSFPDSYLDFEFYQYHRSVLRHDSNCLRQAFEDIPSIDVCTIFGSSPLVRAKFQDFSRYFQGLGLQEN